MLFRSLDYATLEGKITTPEELWANKDPRFFASVYTHRTLWKGQKLDFHNSLINKAGIWVPSGVVDGIPAFGTQINSTYWSGQTGFGVLKYVNEATSNQDATGISSSDWMVFRYGEILMNLAEASFELGKTAEALNAVNQIRDRAGIAKLGSIDRAKIRHERKVELAFEGHRYWDVRRWRTATADLSKSYSGLMYILDLRTGDLNTGKYSMHIVKKIDGAVATPTFLDKHYYLPITLGRTANNENLIENPGY